MMKTREYILKVNCCGEILKSFKTTDYKTLEHLMEEIDQDEFGFVEINDGIYVNRKYVGSMQIEEHIKHD